MRKAKSIHHDAVDLIAGRITEKRYAPGDSLPVEAAICAELGVSRTVVREAIKTLVAKGLVSSGPRVGTRVLPPEFWNLYDPQVIGWRLAAGVDETFLRDVIDLRFAIEPAAAMLAAVHATPADLAVLQAAYRDMADAVASESGYFDADLSFHTAILRATHNQFFLAFIPIVTAVLKVSISYSVRSQATVEASLPLHEAAAVAIGARDSAASAEAMRALITRAREDIHARVIPDISAIRGAA
jgi:DNA-binding FadR family transcriptional regulator